VVPLVFKTSLGAVRSPEGSTPSLLRQITGTLEYQACDDKLCYNPTSVPLSWTVALTPLLVR